MGKATIKTKPQFNKVDLTEVIQETRNKMNFTIFSCTEEFHDWEKEKRIGYECGELVVSLHIHMSVNNNWVSCLPTIQHFGDDVELATNFYNLL